MTRPYAERKAITAALQFCNFNLQDAAKRLAIGRSTLYRLIDQYEIGRPQKKERNERCDDLPKAFKPQQIQSTSMLRERPSSRLELQDGNLVIVNLIDPSMRVGKVA